MKDGVTNQESIFIYEKGRRASVQFIYVFHGMLLPDVRDSQL